MPYDYKTSGEYAGLEEMQAASVEYEMKIVSLEYSLNPKLQLSTTIVQHGKQTHLFFG